MQELNTYIGYKKATQAQLQARSNLMDGATTSKAAEEQDSMLLPRCCVTSLEMARPCILALPRHTCTPVIPHAIMLVQGGISCPGEWEMALFLRSQLL